MVVSCGGGWCQSAVTCTTPSVVRLRFAIVVSCDREGVEGRQASGAGLLVGDAELAGIAASPRRNVVQFIER
jgi:hypothetical protein